MSLIKVAYFFNLAELAHSIMIDSRHEYHEAVDVMITIPSTTLDLGVQLSCQQEFNPHLLPDTPLLAPPISWPDQLKLACYRPGVSCFSDILSQDKGEGM